MGIRAESIHERCMRAIEDRLADGAVVASSDMRAELAAAGFSHGTIYRAADRLGVVSTRDHTWRAGTHWRLP